MTEHDAYRLSVRFGQEILAKGHTAIPNLVLNYYVKLGISGSELLFTIHVWQHWWSDRDPYPSLRTIATRMGISVRQAKRYVESLEAKGYLRVVERFLSDGSQTTNEFDYSPLIRAVVSAARADGTLTETPTPSITRRLRNRSLPSDVDVTGEDVAPVTPDSDTGVIPPSSIHDTYPLTPVSPEEDSFHGDEREQDKEENYPPTSPQCQLEDLLNDIEATSGTYPTTHQRRELEHLFRKLLAIGYDAATAVERIAIAIAERVAAGAPPFDILSLRRALEDQEPSAVGCSSTMTPLLLDLDHLWATVLAELESRITPSNFRRWLARSRLVCYTTGLAEVTAPDQMSADQLAAHFDPLIRRALQQRTGTPVTIRYSVSTPAARGA